MANKNEVFAQQINELEEQIKQMKAQLVREATRGAAATAIEKWAADFYIDLAPESERNEKYYYDILDQIFKIGKGMQSQTEKFKSRMNKTEKIQAEEKINNLVKEMTEKNATLNALADEYMYDMLRKIIFRQFKAHGYDDVIQPDINDTNNVKAKSSGQSLFRAVEKSKKLDRKAEKLAKKNNENVDYPENGFNVVMAAVVEEFEKLEKTFGKAAVEAFKQEYATVEQQEDGVVTSREIAEAVTERSQSIPFWKTTGGKVVKMLAVAAAVVIVGLGIFGLARNAAVKAAEEDNAELKQENTGLVVDNQKKDETIIEKEGIIVDKNNTINQQDETISKQEGEISDLTTKNEQLAAENEALKNSYGIKDDVVTLNPQDPTVLADFNAEKTNIKVSGLKVNNLISCQYNMVSGKVEILLECQNKRKEACVGYLTFSLPAEVASSENILDFDTVMDYAGAASIKTFSETSENASTGANETLNQENGAGTSVTFSIKSAHNGSLTTIKGAALVVTRDEKGNVEKVVVYEASKNYIGNYNAEEAEAAMRQELVNQFTAESELEAE